MGGGYSKDPVQQVIVRINREAKIRRGDLEKLFDVYDTDKVICVILVCSLSWLCVRFFCSSCVLKSFHLLGHRSSTEPLSRDR